MERGGNASNCNMKFIVPNSARIDIADSGNLNLKRLMIGVMGLLMQCLELQVKIIRKML